MVLVPCLPRLDGRHDGLEDVLAILAAERRTDLPVGDDFPYRALGPIIRLFFVRATFEIDLMTGEDVPTQ